MSGIIPHPTIDVLRKFNDLAVHIYGVECTLFIPRNLTSLEHNDAYTSPSSILYTEYVHQKVRVNWAEKNIHRLRKLGMFVEGETPIIGYFKNFPEVLLQSYIQVPIEYIPDKFDTDCFEVVDVLMRGTFDAEVIRPYKLAPLRRKNK
jgi:hypothetical protein